MGNLMNFSQFLIQKTVIITVPDKTVMKKKNEKSTKVEYLEQ